ncbi:MAG: phosphoadenylyl-sulfate reductase [Bacteroidales bacterium]|nr:phosphoadenylyl-sulfate reductase [Bacteroidales bacterium]
MKDDLIKKLNNQFENKSAKEVLEYFLDKYKNRIALSSSLSAEDQAITEMIARIDKTAGIFTLDTGRMFPEIYDLIQKTNSRYKINIKVYFPDARQVEKMVNQKGINLFYESTENRELCCRIRKTEPLNKALKGLSVWITGMRREQSMTRREKNLIEWDDQNNLIKLNPLYNWSEQQVWDYIEENNIPYNKLHKEGFPSIGCQPCTRAVKPGEDIRAGRWWWEMPEYKECGLHQK